MRAPHIALAAAALTPALAWAGAHATSLEARRWRPGTGKRTHVGDLGVRIHGTGDAVVVLLSGLASSERMWGEAYDILGRRAQVVAIDPIGFGASMASPASSCPPRSPGQCCRRWIGLSLLGLGAGSRCSGRR
jgi:pimeloyl-ACP methyl ester carboxylesterase